MPFPAKTPSLPCSATSLPGFAAAVFFLTIYEAWGWEKLRLFTEQGLKTEALWEKSEEEKGITGAMVRESIVNRAPWEHLAPPWAAWTMEELGIPERLRRGAGR
jgi:hypothetical protein